MSKVTAVIVARGGSTRVLRKNMLEIAGKTLVAHKISRLQQCAGVHEVVVGSEDDAILAEAARYGATPVRRPEFYCDETRATANDMIGNMCALIRTDTVLWAHCTNPLVSAATYDRAMQRYVEKSAEGFDSLLSVAEMKEHMWGSDHKPLNYDPYAKTHVLASHLPPLFKQDGAIFIQPYAQMARNHYFFGSRPYLFVMPESEVLDINTVHDFALARAFMESAL
jgi:CMP-N,N'-diacetyllegionaminic acid synthase